MLRLRQVALVAHDRDAVVADLEAVLGLAVGFEDPHIGQLGLHNAVIPVGDQFLEVVAPVQDGTTAGRYLDRRGGDAGYMLIFQTDDHAARAARVEELGVRVVARFDAPGFTDIQLHPADTGGAFIEIDQQEGEGAWSPAGPSWSEAVRTEVVDGITEATVACDDPAGVAARWADLLGLSVLPSSTGPTIPCDETLLRFVEEHDPAAQGIVSIGLSAVDTERALGAAAERGLPVAGNGIGIGGVTMRLLPHSA